MHEIDDRADAWFHALSDRTRRDILRRVLIGEQSVSALARNYDMSLTAVQKHVAVLEGAGLLTRRRSGRESLARGDARTIRSASELLTELEALWRERIARIDDLIGASPETGSSSGRSAEVGAPPEPRDDPTARPDSLTDPKD